MFTVDQLRDLDAGDFGVSQYVPGWTTNGHWAIKGTYGLPVAPNPNGYDRAGVVNTLTTAPRTPLEYLGLCFDHTCPEDHADAFCALYADDQGNLVTIRASYAVLLDGLAVVRLETDANRNPKDEAKLVGRSVYSTRTVAGVNDVGEVVALVQPRNLP